MVLHAALGAGALFWRIAYSHLQHLFGSHPRPRFNTFRNIVAPIPEPLTDKQFLLVLRLSVLMAALGC